MTSMMRTNSYFGGFRMILSNIKIFVEIFIHSQSIFILAKNTCQLREKDKLLYDVNNHGVLISQFMSYNIGIL